MCDRILNPQDDEPQPKRRKMFRYVYNRTGEVLADFVFATSGEIVVLYLTSGLTIERVVELAAVGDADLTVADFDPDSYK